MLTDAKIRSAKPADRAWRLADTGGLFVHITPAGKKIWRYRYKFEKREKLLTLGHYPGVSLAEARAEREEARRILREGRDPSMEAKIVRLAARVNTATTFEAVAREWYEQRKVLWATRHAFDVIRSLERDIFPKLGHVPINGITPPVVLAVLRQIEDRGAIETAHRIRQRMSDVFVHAIASGCGSSDPAAVVAPALRPVIRGRQPAITDLEGLRSLVHRTEAEEAHPVTLLALRLLYLTAVRPGELRFAQWADFEGLDGPKPLWNIPAERMKMKRDHLVPLSRQAVATLEALRPFSGRWPHLFPNTRRPRQVMSENALGYLLNRAGFHHCHVPHGFRASFSTIMNERFRSDRQVIDVMLAHSLKDKVEGAYNRAIYLERRRELAQVWADLVSEGQVSLGELIATKRRSGA
ncbi:integrase arm-type DNA-binding domain-containing protein [Komagataeibacter sp. AV436]|uniref:DUF4102 domain-containing protein n=3 Tax=Komagataeibacter TaxID=1434011 RepID=A0A371YZ58_9PROT|nr:MULTISPECIES: integrase arm-type DNA-binding domain-containing protein [Komagataeibacter]MBV1822777.1 integrase arm-type DNA-binding domain-containing protein [Komagataeibacter oboediens]MBV1829287.1 integrase arm-type DNA-binding domain-containing protein [Komagataeibacter melomenusus]NPC64858.1 integrase arm-type DNA-binding domain-containing protein [Komagataeibacter melomenusus]RFD19530.1 DUF4102 domain-containing protein [Komagataeibacter melaceti]